MMLCCLAMWFYLTPNFIRMKESTSLLKKTTQENELPLLGHSYSALIKQDLFKNFELYKNSAAWAPCRSGSGSLAEFLTLLKNPSSALNASCPYVPFTWSYFETESVPPSSNVVLSRLLTEKFRLKTNPKEMSFRFSSINPDPARSQLQGVIYLAPWQSEIAREIPLVIDMEKTTSLASDPSCRMVRSIAGAIRCDSPPSYCSGAALTRSVFLNGSGTAAAPYLICTINQLNEMRNQLSGYYALASDIDASATSSWNGGQGWEPIGTNSNSFKGQLDGKGYKISRFTINRSATVVAMFAYARDGKIKDLKMRDVSIQVKTVPGSSLSHYFGSLVGLGHNFRLENIELTGAIRFIDSPVSVLATTHYLGGIAGSLDNFDSTVATGLRSSATLEVNLTAPYSNYLLAAGGITGLANLSNFSESTVDGILQIKTTMTLPASPAVPFPTNQNMIGGVIGIVASSQIRNCHFKGASLTVSATNPNPGTQAGGGVGGLVHTIGRNSSIYRSSSSGNISITGSSAAGGSGLVHVMNSATLTESFSTANITASARSVSGAGLVGAMVATVAGADRIKDAYATGNIVLNGNYSSGGGLVGGMTAGLIQNAYATGNILSLGTPPPPSTPDPAASAAWANFYAAYFPGHSIGTPLPATTVYSGSSTGSFLGALGGGKIQNTFSTGGVTLTSSPSHILIPGGHIGEVALSSFPSPLPASVIQQSYWYRPANSAPACAWNAANACTGLTQLSSFYENSPATAATLYSSWDFTNVWKFPNANSFPVLRGVTP